MKMQSRYSTNPTDFKNYCTERIREEFLIEKLFGPDQIHFCYSHYDRLMIGGIKPVGQLHKLPNYDELRAEYFLERRELGVINIGGDGFVMVDGQLHTLQKHDCLYVGRGSKEVSFKSLDVENPAKFVIMSAPAHCSHPTAFMKASDAVLVDMGDVQTANQRTNYKYIYAGGLLSCQLVMGLTVLKNGSVWNTMPPHTHDRRTEAYLYFDLPDDQRVVHLMGTPHETRHVLVSNEQAVISPPWSIHAGAGTANYSFVWAMAGENQEFSDIKLAELRDLR